MTFDEAAAALEAAKIEEARATAKRLEAEQRMLSLIEAKDEGSVTARGHAYRVTVTYGVNRTVDPAALEAVREKLAPAIFERAFRFKPDVNLTGLRYLQANEPELYAIAAQAITAKPAKPSVRVEAVEPVRRAA